MEERDQKDEYDPRTVVLRTENANGDPRLEVYVQLGVLFPADDDKKYAYSGPCGTGKIFAYAEETADKKRFLNLSIADDAQPAKQEEPAAANEPVDDDTLLETGEVGATPFEDRRGAMGLPSSIYKATYVYHVRPLKVLKVCMLG